MIRQILGKKIIEISDVPNSLYSKVVIDVGTGDGKFAYQFARSHPDTLVLATDADKQQMQDLSAKAARKPAKGGLDNILFIWAPAEDMPAELNGIADEVYVNFPWGSLLGGVAKAEPGIMQNLVRMLKSGGKFTVVLTYDSSFEPEKIADLELPELSAMYLEELSSKYKQLGLQVNSITQMSEDELQEMQSSWLRRITSQRERKVYKIEANAVAA